MAVRFKKLYHETNLVGIGTEGVHLTPEEFHTAFEDQMDQVFYKDRNFGYAHDPDSWGVEPTIEMYGVRFFCLATEGMVQEWGCE